MGYRIQKIYRGNNTIIIALNRNGSTNSLKEKGNLRTLYLKWRKIDKSTNEIDGMTYTTNTQKIPKSAWANFAPSSFDTDTISFFNKKVEMAHKIIDAHLKYSPIVSHALDFSKFEGMPFLLKRKMFATR